MGGLIGVDGIGVLLVLLSSWKAIGPTSMISIAVLIPMYLIISFYGSRHRIILLYLETGTTNYAVLMTVPLSYQKQVICFAAFFIAFATKTPLIPVHLWLPEAHVEAPTAASLKLGSYGFLRYSIPLFPDGSSFFTPLVCTFSVACLAQIDLKKIIAYSSIGHMSTATIALFTNDFNGISAGVYFLLSHGIISSALFLLIGVLYDRYHTRTLKYYRGLVMVLPVFTLLFFLFTLANIAGAFNLNPIVAIAASSAIVLAPAYALILLHRVNYGSFISYLPTLYQDITVKELNLFLPLLVATFLFGIFPQFIFTPLHFSCLALLHDQP
ncbi:NADH dehydrogenase subunit 4 [Phlyctochytrium arcticum]|nr:NADH dehydrogenase subunit 4 [Phlyctochytrium arcticum]KAI9088692.1 NADH dehydrogenase subunit 4 [Phlyctochytrium arcticum]